ncbi:hypothetical protein [Pelomonas aquatica]|jgi:hypothetical protein|uniref:Uncharacterized protein n=1 Tax=Pelomonas aquatica TaxID=431058 RepID=A0A9X4LHI6_9BURK|nr:hypothetical protein [Pelomonas aquatica]MCY4753558.1 hypothetical protein [Pelomonas aquatica]MDG0863298.1 hypothetical protein [Pelomonas aquatica]
MSGFFKFDSPFGKPPNPARVAGGASPNREARRHPAAAVEEVERDLTDEEVAKMRAIHAPAGFKPSAPTVD